jgi:hypothetical protein
MTSGLKKALCAHLRHTSQNETHVYKIASASSEMVQNDVRRGSYRLDVHRPCQRLSSHEGQEGAMTVL